MKKYIFFYIALFCISSVFAQKPIIAVYIATNDVDNNETKSIKKVLEAKLVEAIHKSDLFIATERSEAFLAQIRKEHSYQQSGQVSDGQIIEQARKSGAQYLCLADIFELFGDRFVSARLVELKSGDMYATTNSSGSIKSLTDLVLISAEVANNLIKETPQAKMEEQKLSEQHEREEQAREEQERLEWKRKEQEQQAEQTRLAKEKQEREQQEQKAREERLVRQEQERKDLQEKIRTRGISVKGCNDTALPGWGGELGSVSWLPHLKVWKIGSQIWSGTVWVDRNCTKMSFDGGIGKDGYRSDCRYDPEQNIQYFSWCAIMRFGDRLCPKPWRVPTKDDFVALDKALGGYGRENGRLMSIKEGKRLREKYVKDWGAIYSGYYYGSIAHEDNEAYKEKGTGAYYWTAGKSSQDVFNFNSNSVTIYHANNPLIHADYGLPLRCVQYSF